MDAAIIVLAFWTVGIVRPSADLELLQLPVYSQFD